MKTLQTTLHYYRFNLDNDNEKTEYKDLCQSLKTKGLKLFDSISSDHSKFYKELILPLNNTVITLECEHLFNNQWNTAKTETSDKGLRVFDWSEAIYPNKRIKEGMYLDQTEEMTEVRNNTYSCGYCGKNYYKPKVSFCSNCLGSQYLKEDELKMLFLTPISQNRQVNYSSIIVSEDLVKEYNERQKASRAERLNKKKEQKLQSLKNDIKKAEKEYNAFKWLIDHNIDFENCIYYSHTDKFCFGWQTPIEKRIAEKLDHTLHVEGFATYYNFEIKTTKN